MKGKCYVFGSPINSKKCTYTYKGGNISGSHEIIPEFCFSLQRIVIKVIPRGASDGQKEIAYGNNSDVI